MRTGKREAGGLGKWLVATGLAVAALALHLFFQAQPSTEAVRLRNALLMEPEPATRFDWAPEQHPANFQVETLPPDPRFVAVVHALGADRGPDFERMLAIAGHLAEKARDGGPIQADNWTTYRLIREGAGYCADFTQAFLSLAHAAGLSAREWGFSFDGFGGWGHAVVEAYDRQRGRWVFLDVFNNFHVVDRATGEPLDVAAWRQAVPAGGKDVRIVLNGPGRFGWPDKAEEVWDYYRRGLDGWYLWLGNAVETYDRQPLVGLAGSFSRSLEQLAAIAVGVHPHILVLDSGNNRAAFEDMRRLRSRLLVELPALALGGLILPVLGFAWWRRRAQGVDGGSEGPARVLLVGPLPPPAGGMANQCRQLADLLAADGVKVDLLQTNPPYRPAWIGRLRGLRALARLLPYLWRLWTRLPRSDVVHVFANSGWAWHLFAVPAVVLARLRGVPVIVNYHGGEAHRFFATAPAWVRKTLGLADALVVPSGFLEAVFGRLGFRPRVVPNTIDLARFQPSLRPGDRRQASGSPHVIVTRNLEPIYDIPTALKAFGLICSRFPDARLTVAGTGPELENLRALAAEMGISGRVAFPGRIDNRDIHALYASADVLLNPSTADNMPISLLEAFASGVPVVSTDVGGIPYLARNGENALLVGVGDFRAMADAALAILDDSEYAGRLAANGLATVSAFAWPRVRRLWLETYARLLPGKKGIAHA